MSELVPDVEQGMASDVVLDAESDERQLVRAGRDHGLDLGVCVEQKMKER